MSERKSIQVSTAVHDTHKPQIDGIVQPNGDQRTHDQQRET